MEINTQIFPIQIHAAFTDKVCILFGDSGEGKTFFFTALHDYCNLNEIKLTHFSSMNMSDMDSMLQYAASSDIVILDNADLYVSDKLLRGLLKTSKLILISVKDLTRIGSINYGIYDTVYEGETLEVARAD